MIKKSTVEAGDRTRVSMTVEITESNNEPIIEKGVDEVEIDDCQIFLRRYGRPGLSLDFIFDSIKIKLEEGR